MATLSGRGRIGIEQVREEWQRLQSGWQGSSESVHHHNLRQLLTADQINQLDLFDKLQLATVVEVCRRSPSLAAAGRELFSVSRQARLSRNDTDRIRKYLARFEITWADIKDGGLPARGE
jgi:transcriptional regulatory protein RtcR